MKMQGYVFPGCIVHYVTHGSVSADIPKGVGIPSSLGIICYKRWVLRKCHRNYFKDKDKFLIYSHPAFLFVPHFPNSLKCLYYQQYKIQITLDHLTFYSLALPRFKVFAVILLVMSLSLS